MKIKIKNIINKIKNAFKTTEHLSIGKRDYV
jgi:hypothetical protein